MGKGIAILVIGCAATLALFGTMCYLIKDVNPKPLQRERQRYGHDPLYDEFIHARSSSLRPDNEVKSSALRTSQSSYKKDDPDLRKLLVTENYTSLLKHSIQRVVPPVWPTDPKQPISEIVKVPTPENRALNETAGSTSNYTRHQLVTINDTMSVIKRSVKDIKQVGGDLNSIILKIIDDSGQFNIEIKIGLSDAIVNKNNDTKEDQIQSKDKSKYSISLKTKDNVQFKKSKLGKNTIMRLMPKDFVPVVEYDDHLEAENNMIEASSVDYNNITKYNITENKATVMPIYRDVFKPIAIFYNQTKSIYHYDTETEKIDILEKPNNTCKTNDNSFKTANNTAYNVTTQTEKGDKKTENGEFFEKPNDASERCKTNVNSSKTAYNLTTQTEKDDTITEKGDLLQKPNDASDGRETTHNRFKTANNTAYNLTEQTEKANNTACNLTEQTEKANNTAYNLTEQTEKGNNTAYNLTEQTEKANNTAYNLTEQTEKANNTACNLTEQTEKGNNTAYNLTEQTEKANNTAYNLTIQTEKSTLQNNAVTTRNEDTTVEAGNSTISTKSLDESSTMAEEEFKFNSTNPLVNGNSTTERD